MPITISEVKQYIQQLGYSYSVPPGHDSDCCVSFSTRSYTDPDGDQSLMLVCSVRQDGGYLEIYAPTALSAANCRYKSALFRTLLEIGFRTKHLQLEHDPEDGEIRFSVDYPVCDGTVTITQFNFMLGVIISSLEQYYPVLKHAMDTGKVDWERRWLPTS